MRLKSAYREKPTEAPNIPEEPPQPSETTRVEFTNGAAEPVQANIAAIEPATPDVDEATQALMRQLGHLRQSEALQRQHATQMAQMAAPAPTLPAEPEARITLWRQHGLSDGDANFLATHLELAAEPALCRLASDEAALHHERDTDAHRAATLEAFHRLQGQQAQPAADPAGFFQPPEATRSPAPESVHDQRASIVSAPVSRRDAGAPREPQHPRQVKLSPIEQEIARNLGLSDVAYAEGKLAMQRRKASGELQ
jgi:hypothetical protein